jgi:hypothetical protein
VKLKRTSSQKKDIQKVNSSNRCHGMTRHEIANAMVLASALMGGISPLDVRHFEYYQGGGWMPLKRSLARTMASAFWWRITVTPKSLENHRKNQEVGLLCSLACDFVSSNFPICTRHTHAITLANKMASWKTRTFALYCGLFGPKFLD